MDTIEIANTIKRQIGTNFGGTLMCIGAHEFLAIPRNDNDGVLGGLRFKINPNPKLKVAATVSVVLRSNDTYNVMIVTCRGKEVLNLDGVYGEDLSGPNGVIERVTG